jgi:hypothetical protein
MGRMLLTGESFGNVEGDIVIPQKLFSYCKGNNLRIVRRFS